MTNQDENIIDEKNENIIDEKASLEEKLQQIQQDKLNQDAVEPEQEVVSLKEKINQLEIEKKDSLEIARKAQYDYINLKMDFDRIQRQMEEQKKSGFVDSLVQISKKILPFVEQLRVSLDHVLEENKDDQFVQWVRMIYENLIKTLDGMWIKSIESLWLVPDSLLHEPLSVKLVEDENLKWKIVEEFQRWFIYQKWDDKIVILTSKVVVWN